GLPQLLRPHVPGASGRSPGLARSRTPPSPARSACPRRPRHGLVRRTFEAAGVRSRHAIVTGRGGPEVLEVAVREAPAPRRGEVRIAVEAAGVAFGDVVRRRGVMAPRRPFTPGYDVVGIVDAVGPDVDTARLGGRGAAMMPTMGIGGYAEHVCVPAARLVDVPDGIDPAIAVSLGLNYITAYQLLCPIAPLRPREKLP